MPNIKRANTSGITKSGVAIADVPDAPTIGSATAGIESATVTYTAATTGGTATTFTATSTPGSVTGTGSSPITVAGLTGGTSYTFTIRASNSTGNSPFSSASNSVTPTVATSYESIATVSVGAGGSAYISFSSIPSTYKHLQLRAIHRITTNATGSRRCILQINGDTTASNYRNHWLYGNGASAASETDGTNPIIAYSTDAANIANTFATTIIDILDYSSSDKRKTIRSFNGQDVNGVGGLVGVYSMANYNSISAITSLTFRPNTGADSLAQYSHFALYGIKG